MNINPTAVAGPRRLILIQSGKYDYAELDLTKPFQLVGINGLGKTALISTLQYLYLDSQRDMRFGQHSTDESRRFYFKSDSSFMLFECETSLGITTIGARGLGPVAGYELQRFAWTGPFDRADFIGDDRRPRSWDDVRANLATKSLRIISDNLEYRRLLGAVDDETNTSWEIVPLTDARDYPRFRQTFQRLLQLRDLRQDDLKQLLADCAKLSGSEREIDLAKDFETELGRINADRAEVAALRLAVPRVKKARELCDKEATARAIAHAVVREMQDRYTDYAAWFKAETDALFKVRDDARRTYERLEGERKELSIQQNAAAGSAGAAQSKLDEIERKRREYAEFVVEVEEQGRDRLSDEVNGLKIRLADVPAESLAVLQTQLTDLQGNLVRCEESRRKFSHLLITWLRARLPEQSVARVGALFERGILQSIVDEDVTIADEKLLLERLRTAAGHCDPRGYEDEAISIEFAAGAVAAVSKMGQPESLDQEIRRLQREIARLTRDIETVSNAEKFRTRLPVAQKELNVQTTRLNGYRAFQEESAKRQEYEFARERSTSELQRIMGLLAQNEIDRNQARQSGEQALAKFDKFQDEDREIRREAGNLPSPDGENPGRTPVGDETVRSLPKSLLDVIRVARERCNQARTRAAELVAEAAILDKGFLNPTFRYDHAAPIADRLAQLEAEIESLDERTTNIERRWGALLTDARSSFATILKSLHAVKRQANKLTNELAKIEFSSLADVRLEIIPDEKAVAEYERHAKDSAQPSLFDTADEADRKLTQFGELLRRRPKLMLNELFSLRCDVRRNDGQKNSYDNFDQVESTGTTVVLKVTLNLLVLRDLLIPGKARIPYYLDEVHALDRQNFSNILQLSERLGFVGIYAAPTAAVGPRCFVHLTPDAKGRLVVTEAHRKEIVRTPEESGENRTDA